MSYELIPTIAVLSGLLTGCGYLTQKLKRLGDEVIFYPNL
jgi:hypothetical protein